MCLQRMKCVMWLQRHVQGGAAALVLVRGGVCADRLHALATPERLRREPKGLEYIYQHSPRQSYVWERQIECYVVSGVIAGS
mmetsp:Transcript_17373/g.25545  ORF Transcript_17373/g.25545 Transcript_17373/m.25545 type:complete len:82 (+) Transcript_17373:115-360(+)